MLDCVSQGLGLSPYGYYHCNVAAAVDRVFVLATARLVSYVEYSSALSAREDIFNMVSLNGDNGSKYNIGTSAETFFL